jgi:hypothetical protein
MDETEDRLAQLERMAGLGTSARCSPDLTLLSATPAPGSATTRPQIVAARVDGAEINEDVTE